MTNPQLEGRLTNNTWLPWARAIAAPADITEYDPPAMQRFMSVMNEFIVDVKNVRPKFPARNRVEKISFANAEQRKQYQLAWERYEREMILLRGEMKELGTFQQLVAMMKFNQAAELIRHEEFSKRIVRINGEGKAAVLAVKFKETIAATVKDLIKNYGYKRSDISIIWGGMGGTFTADGKVKLREKRIPERTFKMLEPSDLDMLKSLNVRLLVIDENEKVLQEIELSQELDERKKLNEAGLKSVDAADLSVMKLGTQSVKSRQQEIDAFQSGKTKVCVFTFKAGGVGLSLHHHDDTCKQRESVIAPCYSAIELVQGLGRAPRLTSLSETVQTMLYYKGTIEEHVADKVSQKLRCLKEVVRQRESWEDVICEAAEKQMSEFTSAGSDDVVEIIDGGDLGASEEGEEEDNQK